MQDMSPEDRLKVVRQIGLSALSAVDLSRKDVVDGRSDRALAAIAQANGERLGDPEVAAVLANDGMSRYEKLVNVAQRAADLGAEIEAPFLPTGWSVTETIAARKYQFDAGNAEVSVTKAVNRDSMRITVYGFNTWSGYEGNRSGYVPLAVALKRAEETLADPSSHLSEYGVQKVAEAKDIVEKNREELIATVREDQQRWQETADRYKNVLLGERNIVLDKHERAFSQIYENGEPAIKLELPDSSLSGVSFMTAENANKVRADLEGRWPEFSPYVAVDFQQYAQSKAVEAENIVKHLVGIKWSADREALTLDDAKELAGVVIEQLGYTVPAWRKSESSLTPWEYADVEVGGRTTLTVGASSGGVVAINGDPFTPGDRKTNVTRERVVESMQAGVDFLCRGLGKENQDLCDPLFEALKETNPDAAALHENIGELVRLSTMHTKLAGMVSEDMNLSYDEEFSSVKEGLRDAIRNQIGEIDGISEVEFTMDSRFSTVILQLENGRSNRMSGGWGVPVDDALLDGLDYGDDIASVYGDGESPEKASASGFVVLNITETGNAAFADVGRDQEIARIIEEAATKIADSDSVEDTRFFLRDTNGNKVGKVEHTTAIPTGEPEDGTVRLAVELGNAAFEDGPAGEVARILREAAGKVREGEHVFAMRDYNGNLVGKFEFREEASLEKGGVVDMNAALNSGRVYLGEDGYSGIADGEYRYVVTTPDFEPGYGQGEGEVWLVNAKGEVASGYEEPQSVREVMFRELNRDEKSELRAVAEGRVAFEDFERKFSGDDCEP